MPNIDKLKIVNNMTMNDMRSILVFMILIFLSTVNGQQFFKLFLFLILYFLFKIFILGRLFLVKILKFWSFEFLSFLN